MNSAIEIDFSKVKISTLGQSWLEEKGNVYSHKTKNTVKSIS